MNEGEVTMEEENVREDQRRGKEGKEGKEQGQRGIKGNKER